MFFWRCKTTVCCKPCIKNIFAKTLHHFQEKLYGLCLKETEKNNIQLMFLHTKKILSTVTIVFMLLERRNVSWLRNRFLFRWKLTLGISRQLTKELVLFRRKLTLGTGFCLGESWLQPSLVSCLKNRFMFRWKLTSAISNQPTKEPVCSGGNWLGHL